jgi:hypothetical protein
LLTHTSGISYDVPSTIAPGTGWTYGMSIREEIRERFMASGGLAARFVAWLRQVP